MKIQLLALLAGLGAAVLLGGLWTWFVRKRQPALAVRTAGWIVILALVLAVLFMDLYLPS